MKTVQKQSEQNTKENMLEHLDIFQHLVSTRNKTISTGEGGMVISNDSNLIERAIHYKTQGLAKNRQYWHDVMGFNYRMTNICAAMGLAQIEKIELIIKEKEKLQSFTQMNLKKLNKLNFTKNNLIISTLIGCVPF